MFLNRIDAGRLLADALINFKGQKETVVVAIPRGGIEIGYVIAKKLDLPLEITLIKKLSHPVNPEFAIGAVSLRGKIINDNLNIPADYIERETKRIQEFLRHRYKMYYEDLSPLDLKNKTIILVDDGVATGNTLIAAIKLIRQAQPKKIIVGIPVGPGHIINKIRVIADEVVCLIVNDFLESVGQYYKDFSEVSDNEMKKLLHQVNK